MTYVYVCESCGAVYDQEPDECENCDEQGVEMREEAVRNV